VPEAVEHGGTVAARADSSQHDHAARVTVSHGLSSFGRAIRRTVVGNQHRERSGQA